MRILFISGSLRESSSNTEVLKAAAHLAPPGYEIVLFDGLGELPHFNPDLEADPPQSVRRYTAALREADAVLFCSPEYAHGVPGVLKNALDWVVGSGELMDKRVGVINASPSSTYAHGQILETLRTMSARPVEEACLTLPFKPVKMNAHAIAADPRLAHALRGVLDALYRAG